jgi:FtsH-binding integral membrane protein
MMILRFAGYALVVLGIMAGALLFLPAYGKGLAIAPLGLWFLFLACLLVGLILVAITSQEAPRPLLRGTGGVLVLIALVAVVAILLSATGLVAAADASNLWALFLLCLPCGIVLVLAGDKLGLKRKKKTMTLQEMQDAAKPAPGHPGAP